MQVKGLNTTDRSVQPTNDTQLYPPQLELEMMADMEVMEFYQLDTSLCVRGILGNFVT